MHKVGVVVRTRPEFVHAVEQRIRAQPGAEVHAVSEDGRMVVTLEGENRRSVADMIYQLDALPGVLNAAMAYEHSDYDPKQLEASQ
jgi:nitrate reductase NapD